MKCEPNVSKKKIFASLLFVPGFYLMVLFTTGLIIFVGSGLIFIIHYFVGKFLGELGFAYFGLILLDALPFFGMIFGVVSCFIAIISMFFKNKQFEPAILINPHDHPKLRDLISELSGKMGSQMPDSIILHVKSNFFVSEGKVNVFNGIAKGRIISISYPLLHVLSVNELRAILAHELSHFTGRDLVFNRFVSPVYKGANKYLEYISSVFNYRSRRPVILSIPMILPNLLMKYYLRFFHKFNMKISREMEYRADYIASKVCGNENYKEALSKLISHGHVFNRLIDEQMTEKIVHGFQFENYFSYYREHIGSYKKQIEESLGKALSDNESEYATHPTLKNRIVNLPNVDTKYDNNEKALELINSFDYLEVNMTKHYNYYLNLNNNAIHF
jgi:Zn-dependent protease with chaperone function